MLKWRKHTPELYVSYHITSIQLERGTKNRRRCKHLNGTLHAMFHERERKKNISEVHFLLWVRNFLFRCAWRKNTSNAFFFLALSPTIAWEVWFKHPFLLLLIAAFHDGRRR
jgi:hypothetical protein